jgi:hypothetical protein
MKRLLRILLKTSTLVSLVALAVSLCLWVRSYWRSDSVTVDWSEASIHSPAEYLTRSVGVATRRGGLWCYRARYSGSIYVDNRPGPTRVRFESFKAHADHYLPDSAADPARWHGGFAYGWISSAEDVVGLRVPFWAIAVLSALLPLLMLWRYGRRRRRIDRRLCVRCGYDLRATPDRCPECGKIPTVANAATPRSFAARPAESLVIDHEGLADGR